MGNVVLYLLMLIVVPVFVGNALCDILRANGTLPRSFCLGHIGMWAIFQIVTVPLILCRTSFLVDVCLYSAILAGLIGYGIRKKAYRKLKIPKLGWKEWLAAAVMIAATGYIMVQAFRLQLTNADDSRFVVNAVDTVRTNRMLLTDVNTGKEIGAWTGDLYKDVISPWSVYAAYLAKMTGIPAASMMHTYLPPILLLLMCGVFWMIAGELVEGVVYRAGFVSLIVWIYIFGYYSIYSVETFTLTRLWQGKAVLAAVGIPAQIFSLFWLYRGLKDHKDTIGQYVLVWMTVFANALLSSMSYIITTLLVGCFGLVYGIMSRRVKPMLLAWVGCLINVLYLGISFLIH